MTSKATGGPHADNDSTEDIFPRGTNGDGTIVITHEMTRDVESRLDSTNSSVTGSVKHEEYQAVQDKRR